MKKISYLDSRILIKKNKYLGLIPLLGHASKDKVILKNHILKYISIHINPENAVNFIKYLKKLGTFDEH